MIYNCPQTKFAKVMFLHLSVSHSVHRGGGIPACLAGLQAHTQGGVEGSGRGGVLQAHTQGGSWGVWPGVWSPGPHLGVGSPGPHRGGVCVSQHALRQTPLPLAGGYCYEQYASYWNAFLFNVCFYLAGVPRTDDHIRDVSLDPALSTYTHPYQRYLCVSSSYIQVTSPHPYPEISVCF